jgi:hypothetical protein
MVATNSAAMLASHLMAVSIVRIVCNVSPTRGLQIQNFMCIEGNDGLKIWFVIPKMFM